MNDIDKFTRKKILILGDSHAGYCTKLKSSVIETKLCVRQSATAYGLMNVDSSSGANLFFRRFLNNEYLVDLVHPERKYFADFDKKKPDYIAIALGEVDCRSLAFKKKGKTCKEVLVESAQELESFCKEYLLPLVSPAQCLILGPHLSKNAEPALVRDQNCTLDQITENTRFLCELYRTLADRNDFGYADIFNDL